MKTGNTTAGLTALEIGDEVSFSKTVGESDVYMFAGSPETSSSCMSTKR